MAALLVRKTPKTAGLLFLTMLKISQAPPTKVVVNNYVDAVGFLWIGWSVGGRGGYWAAGDKGGLGFVLGILVNIVD